MPKIKLITSVALILFTAWAMADTPYAILYDPENQGLREVYNDEVPVSGRVIAGIVLEGVEFAGRMAVFAGSQDTSKPICVQVMTRDGRYWAENQFVTRTPGVGGSIELRYESKYDDELQDLHPDDLAILSHPNDCDNRDFEVYLPGAFHHKETGEASLKIFVNSGRSDTFLRVIRPNNNTTLKCQRIQEGRRTAYDSICEVKLSSEDFTAKHLDLKVVRRKYNRSFPPENLMVRLPFNPANPTP